MPFPNVKTIGADKTYESESFESVGIIKASRGKLFSLSAWNEDSTDHYIQLHDATSTPANDSLSTACNILVAAKTFGYFEFGNGSLFKNGIVVCSSSTSAILTLTGNAFIFKADFN